MIYILFHVSLPASNNGNRWRGSMEGGVVTLVEFPVVELSAIIGNDQMNALYLYNYEWIGYSYMCASCTPTVASIERVQSTGGSFPLPQFSQ